MVILSYILKILTGPRVIFIGYINHPLVCLAPSINLGRFFRLLARLQRQ